MPDYMTIDTLGYAKRLEAAGMPREQAEAHAGALRASIVPPSGLATSTDDRRLSYRTEAVLWKWGTGVILVTGVLALFALK